MAKRVLTQITVAFLLGVIGSEYRNGLLYGLWALYALGLAVVCTGGTQQKKTGQRAGAILRLGLILTFLLLGFGRRAGQQALIAQTEQRFTEGEALCVTGTIYKKEEKNGNFIYYLKHSEILDDRGSSLCGHVQVYHDAGHYSIGETIKVTGTGAAFREARNEGNFNEKEFFYSKNILLRIKVKKIITLKQKRFPWQEGLSRLRKEIRQVYANYLSPRDAGVLGVMTLGEKSMLESETKALYQQAGLSHVLAISGLHVSILGMGCYRFFRKRGFSYLGAGFPAGLLAVAFGEISGMELSTRRAVLMFLVLLLGNVLGMAYDSVTALSFAGLMQLWENPGSLWQAGFLFSYSAVLGVVVVAHVLKRYWSFRWKETKKDGGTKWRKIDQKIWKVWKETFFISVCIQLVTLPLNVYFYYEVSVYSVFLNCLLLPFMGIILTFGLFGGAAGFLGFSGGLTGLLGFSGKLTGLLGFSGGLTGLLGVSGKLTGLLGLEASVGNPFGAFWGFLAELCFWPVRMLLGFNQWVLSRSQELPYANWITGKPGLPGMVLYYLLLAAVLYWMERRTRSWERQKRWEEAKGTKGTEEESGKKGGGLGNGQAGYSLGKRMLLSLLPVAGLLLLLLVLRPREKNRICFLDVGQGDAVFVQSREGSTFFLDGGSSSESKIGEYRILSFLKYHGVSSIDGWFVSHGDKDHISGLWELWENGFRIDTLFLSREMVKDEVWEEICRQAKARQTKIQYLKPGDTVETTALKWTCLYPREEEGDRNAASLGLLLELKEEGNPSGLRGFFAGDIGTEQERKLLENNPDLKADLYKASHHGSNSANGEELLKQLNPDITIISCAEKNSYGHPGEEAVARILKGGSRIFYTMESGQITVESREAGMWVWTFLE